MIRRFKSIISLLLCLCMVIPGVPTVFAAKSEDFFTDMPPASHWSYPALRSAVDNSLLQGYDGKLNPDGNVTRAQLAAILTRAFGAFEEADISGFSDVSSDAWYHGCMGTALCMGLFTGNDRNQLLPERDASRQEAFCVLARALMLEGESTAALDRFSDRDEVAPWAQAELAALVENGLVNGTPEGRLCPGETITRTQFVQMLHNAFVRYVNAEDTVTGDFAGSVLISSPDVTLRDCSIHGDLIIGEGVGSGKVTLDGISVSGRILIRGGGEQGIVLQNTTASRVVVKKTGSGSLRIVAHSDCQLGELTISAGEDKILLEGNFDRLVIDAPVKITTKDAKLGSVELTENAAGADVSLEGQSLAHSLCIKKEAAGVLLQIADESVVERLDSQANNVTVSGEGKLEKATVSGNDTQINVDVAQLKVEQGTTGVTNNGNAVKASSNDSNDSDGSGSSLLGGMDKFGRLEAPCGTPESVDGVVDSAWTQVKPVALEKRSMGDTNTTATIRVLWDDYAIYYLIEVSDVTLDNSDLKDDVAFLLDQNNDGHGIYDYDDCSFRVNRDNQQSCDYGVPTAHVSATQNDAAGYVVEGCIIPLVTPTADMVMGMECQVKDVKGNVLVAERCLFDATGSTANDTTTFGKLVLSGQTVEMPARVTPYPLIARIAEAKDIEIGRYDNGDVVNKLINQAEEALKDTTSSQTTLNTLSEKLQQAVDNLMHNGVSFDEKECRAIPTAYRLPVFPEEDRGTVILEHYETNSDDDASVKLEKEMLVYLPPHYDQNDLTKKYNVLYMLHGYTESPAAVLGQVGQGSQLTRLADYLILQGKMEPMIIVAPTWYIGTDKNTNEILLQAKDFHKELTEDVIPTIESKYRTYAGSTSESALIAAREHRAIGGFDLGAACVWYNYCYSVDYFKYYVPISMWCWQDVDTILKEGYKKYNTDGETLANYLATIPSKAGITKDDIRLFCATGTSDLAYGGMNTQIEEMKKLTEMFVFSADLRKGNCYYLTLPYGEHNWNYANLYLYNILPDLFHHYWTDDYGLTSAGEAAAQFGSPIVDGTVDAIWSEARTIVPKYSTASENTSARFKAMWDDTALYILAQVQDENVTKNAVSVNQQDSIEILLDQIRDETTSFQADDLHVLINYANEQTVDKGESTRLNSKTSLVEGGYVVETRIAWKNFMPANDGKVGLELTVNDSTGDSYAGAIHVFDSTGDAWQNTACLGNLILKEKPAD